MYMFTLSSALFFACLLLFAWVFDVYGNVIIGMHHAFMKFAGVEEMVESLQQQNALLEQRELERVDLEQRPDLVKNPDVFVCRSHVWCAFED